VGARAGGAALRLLFDLGALAEALRTGRPGLALAGLHPADRRAARALAARRTARTAVALALLRPLVAPAR
jgi:hypothetical protein